MEIYIVLRGNEPIKAFKFLATIAKEFKVSRQYLSKQMNKKGFATVKGLTIKQIEMVGGDYVYNGVGFKK